MNEKSMIRIGLLVGVALTGLGGSAAPAKDVTADGKSFSELFSFEAPTFARSMEYLDGYLYFGLGTEVKEHGHFEGNSLKLKFSPNEVSAAAGTILRYRVALK